MNLTELLEPIAQFFRSLNLPEPVTHWGHPIMMGIVIFVMGAFLSSPCFEKTWIPNVVTRRD